MTINFFGQIIILWSNCILVKSPSSSMNATLQTSLVFPILSLLCTLHPPFLYIISYHLSLLAYIPANPNRWCTCDHIGSCYVHASNNYIFGCGIITCLVISMLPSIELMVNGCAYSQWSCSATQSISSLYFLLVSYIYSMNFLHLQSPYKHNIHLLYRTSQWF